MAEASGRDPSDAVSVARIPVPAPDGLPDVGAMPAGDLVGLWARVLVQARGMTVPEVEAFAVRVVEAAGRLAPARSGEIAGARGGARAMA